MGQMTVADQMAQALRIAQRDIQEWVRLARRQQAEIPDYGHCPWAPTDGAIASSEAVVNGITLALQRHAAATPKRVACEACDGTGLLLGHTDGDEPCPACEDTSG